MNLNFKQFSNSVVTKGDYGLVTGGTNLIAGTRRGGKGLLYNVSPGQPVAYYVENGVATTLDESNLTEAILKKGIHIGVGVDLDGDGLVEGIRLIGQDKNDGCLLKEFRTIAPTCGTPEVEDLLFKDIKCDKTYSALVTVDDNLSRSFAPYLKTALEFVGSVSYDCATCDTCEEGVADAGEVACKLVDALNNDILLKLKDKSYPDWNPRSRVERPYRAVKLHPYSYVFCFNPQTEEGACEDCTYVDAITTVTVNNEEITLQGTTNPADNTQTLVAQLWQVADQIEKAFEDQIGKHSGSAYVTKGVGNCCAVQLHINTCDDTFAILDSESNAIEPCSTLTPLADEYPVDSDCVDCDDSPSVVTYEAGIRIIAKPVDLDCNCYLEKPRNMYTRLIDIDAIGDGWSCSPFQRNQVQNAAPPHNFGEWVKWREYQQAPGGKMRSYSRGNNHQGWLGLPDKTARVNNAITYAECGKSYCEYMVEGDVATKLPNLERSYMTYKSSIFVPQNDTTTKTSIETFLATVADIAPTFCNTLEVLDCDGEVVVIS